MGTAVVESALVISFPAEILGPGSEYDKRRLALQNEYNAIIAEAKKVTAITSPAEAEKATNLGRILQAAAKDADVFFKPIKQQIDSVKKPVLEHEKTFLASVEDSKRRLGTLLTGWNQECDRKRQEEERKAREEAEAQAREEALQAAVEREQAGDTEAAEAILEAPIFTPVATLTSAPPKVSGQVSKTAYSAEVSNLMELVKAVAEGRAPIQCIEANQSYLNGLARLNRESFAMPGCKLKKDEGTHFRA